MTQVYIGDEIAAVRRLHGNLENTDFRSLPIREQLDRQAENVWNAHRTKKPAVVFHITCWHPNWVGHSAEEIMAADFTLSDARETIAREYGFDDWDDVESRGVNPPDSNFEIAVDTLLAGDLPGLQEALAQQPDLVHARSSYGHQSTLLHYVGSNGVETYRQVVPLNLAEVAKMLIDAGADVNAEANMYGGGAQTLGLLITSVHPAEAGVMDDVVRVLIDAGAERDES